MKQQPHSPSKASKAVAAERKQVMIKRRSGAASSRDLRQLDILIRDRAWHTVRSALGPKDKSSKKAAKRALQRRRSSTLVRRGSASYLSLALSCDAPADVVSAILRLDPSAASRYDRSGRLPLHVACMYGASVAVLQKLLLAEPFKNEEGGGGRGDEKDSEKKNVDTATASIDGATATPFALRADSDGRVPLHYAAEYAVGSYGYTLDAMAVLGAACPEAALARDRWDETPMGVATAMGESAKLDGDYAMVEAVKVVGWVLSQASAMQKRSRRLGKVWTRGSAMLRKSVCKSMVQAEKLMAAKVTKNGENKSAGKRENYQIVDSAPRKDGDCESELDAQQCRCGMSIAEITSEPYNDLPSPIKEFSNSGRRLFKRSPMAAVARRPGDLTARAA